MKTRQKKNKYPRVSDVQSALLQEILIDLRRSLCQPLLHDPGLCHTPLSMNNQVILRLYNDRGQVPYQRCDTIMHFSTFSAFLKSSIKTLNDYRPILVLGLKKDKCRLVAYSSSCRLYTPSSFSKERKKEESKHSKKKRNKETKKQRNK